MLVHNLYKKSNQVFDTIANMIKQHIHFVKMGGTIEFHDPTYDDINKKLLKLDPSIDSYLKNIIQPHFTFSSELVAEKDSRHITSEDREKLALTIQETNHDSIIVTHGTFTLTKTASFLHKMDWGGKRIILTGSMIPITGFAASDGGFNIGFAIASFSNLQPGVYVSINGGIFSPDEVDKNIGQLRFE